MSAAQGHLFNTRSLSSAREINAMKRAKAALPYKRMPPPEDRSKPIHSIELNLPDEDRILRGLFRTHCPSCNWIGPELRRWQGLDMCTKYAVRCPRCKFGTEPQPSSKKAVELWQITSKLM